MDRAQAEGSSSSSPRSSLSSPRSSFASPTFTKHAHLLDNELYSDITFVIGDRRIHAHRAIIEGRAPGLAATFDPQVAKQTLRLDDVAPEVFLELLRYIYANKTNLSGRQYEDLLVAASRAGMTDLKMVCESWIASQLDRENALRVFRFARLHNASTLESRVKLFVAKHAASIGRTDEFQQLDVNEICDLFKAVATNAVNREARWRRRWHQPRSKSLSTDLWS